MTRSVGFWLLILLGATVALVFVLNELYPGALDDPDSRMCLLTRIGWMALIGSAVIGAARFNPKTALAPGRDLAGDHPRSGRPLFVQERRRL